MISLGDVKLYLRLDGMDEDAFLNNLISSAQIFIKNAIGEVNQTDMYDLANKMLILQWYERGIDVQSIPTGLPGILQMIKFSDIPAIPTGLANNAGVLSWTANTETDLAGYYVYLNSSKITDIITGTTYTTSSSGTYQISSVDKSGNESGLSNSVTV